jgi:thiol:disulfide interchange protein DsbD
VATLLSFCSVPAFAEAPKDLVKAKLIFDASAVKPGEAFTAGVLLEIAPQWHVYWTNPGDSGLPTRVKFELPPGFRAGQLQFPTPHRFKGADDAVMFGYGESVLLTARIETPADWKGTDPINVVANVSWLCCRDVCLPGKTKLEAALPVSAKPAPSNADVFRAAKDQLPVDATASQDVERVDWTSDAVKGQAVAMINWKAKAGDVDVFPAADDTLEVRTLAVESDGSARTRLTVSVRVLAGQKADVAALAGVIGYTTKAGERRGVQTSIPVPAPTPASK